MGRIAMPCAHVYEGVIWDRADLDQSQQTKGPVKVAQAVERIWGCCGWLYARGVGASPHHPARLGAI